MLGIFFSIMFVVIVLTLILSHKKSKKIENPLNPNCDKKECAGCKYYNDNVCDK